jgi:hypothetical protein
MSELSASTYLWSERAKVKPENLHIAPARPAGRPSRSDLSTSTHLWSEGFQSLVPNERENAMSESSWAVPTTPKENGLFTEQMSERTDSEPPTCGLSLTCDTGQGGLDVMSEVSERAIPDSARPVPRLYRPPTLEELHNVPVRTTWAGAA